nr:MAG TPA: terminase large subunit [Caudoviricetes sp.]
MNSEIHSNCYSRLYSGKVGLLIKEQEAKNKLMATKVGQKMSVEDRAKRLLPHEITTRLCDELGNLRLKQTGN